MRSGQLMLESMRGAGDVGIYSAAARLSEAWNFIPVSLVASAFPKIVQSRPNTALYYTQISRLMVALVTLAYLAGIAATLLSDPVVRWLYGETYACRVGACSKRAYMVRTAGWIRDSIRQLASGRTKTHAKPAAHRTRFNRKCFTQSSPDPPFRADWRSMGNVFCDGKCILCVRPVTSSY